MDSDDFIKRKNARLSSKQLDLMISYMETNKDLRDSKLNTLLSKRDRKRKWIELADILNAEGAAVKTPDQWRKSWNDQKAYARNKAVKLKPHAQAPGVQSSETLTPMEERILRMLRRTPPSVNEPTENVLHMSTFMSPVEVSMIEDAFVAEPDHILPIKEEIQSDESNTIEDTNPSQICQLTTLSSGPSLPDENQSAFAEVNLNKQINHFEIAQSSFVPVILNPSETEKSEDKPASSKELSSVLETLKQQNDFLKRIATANEQIAHACAIIANNTEERTKETSLQTELIKDINQTLKYVLKQKSTANFF